MDNILNKKVIRFFSAGAFNTLLGFGLFPSVYYVFSTYQNHYVIMLVICQCICILNSYLTNKYFVFKTKGQFGKEIPRFIAFHLFYFFVASVITPFLVESWSMNPVFIQLGISIIIVLTSYFWYDHFAFLNRHVN